MKSRRKKKHYDIISPFILIGLAVCLVIFGLFSALMVASLKWSAETTVLQMTFRLPAWELTAIAAFVGLVIAMACLMFFEHQILYRNQGKEIKSLEKKIDRLIYEQRKRSIILKNVEEDNAITRSPEEVKERLPFEGLDDFMDTFIGMTDAEIEDVAIQLLNEDTLIITEADTDPIEEKSEFPKVIPFKKKNQKTRKDRRK